MELIPAKRRLWGFIDRLTLTRISIAVLVLTFGSAAIYWSLSVYSSSSYLVENGARNTSPWSALYFSIMTETTAGAGDLVPLGWSRAIASLQVLTGLILAGLAVAKLASLQGKRMRATAHKATGTWIEPYRMPDGQILVSLSFIYEADGEIHYDGQNFDEHGNSLGFFTSRLLESAANVLTFRYSNRDSGAPYFGEGLTTHMFIVDQGSGLWNRHHCNCHDWRSDFKIKYQGYRASGEESAIISGPDEVPRCQLVTGYCDRLRQAGPSPPGHENVA